MKDTKHSFVKTWLKIVSIVAALALLLPLFACSSDDTNEEAIYDVNTEEGQLMEANRRFLVDNLPMINFNDYYFKYFLEALQLVGCDGINKVEIISYPKEYAEMYDDELFTISITDSKNDVFEAKVDKDGYCSTILYDDENGVQTTYIEHIVTP